MEIEITDQCKNCGKAIYWGNELNNKKKNSLYPPTWEYWRHEESRMWPCDMKRPTWIMRAQPIIHRTPPISANISDTLKAELKQAFPNEFPDY